MTGHERRYDAAFRFLRVYPLIVMCLCAWECAPGREPLRMESVRAEVGDIAALHAFCYTFRSRGHEYETPSSSAGFVNFPPAAPSSWPR